MRIEIMVDESALPKHGITKITDELNTKSNQRYSKAFRFSLYFFVQLNF